MRFITASTLLWGCLLPEAIAGLASPPPTNELVEARAVTLSSFVTPQNASASDIKAAESIVKDAIDKMAKLNKARIDHPHRNNFSFKPGTNAGNKTKRADVLPPPPLLEITDEISRAAALIASIEGDPTANKTAPKLTKRAGTFWMESIGHKGSVPWGNDASYKVFRNVVTDYGADNTGTRDATAAIQKAIDDGKRCGAKCNGSTTKNAIVYFPPGRYLVSSSISVYFGTQIIGDANNWPTIVGAASFVGLGVLSTDVYVENGGTGPDGKALEWYINTARFYGQIRNLRIDITATPANACVAALHYQVAQATTIENVELIANSATTQQGIFAENGSGGVISDITFTGGNFGIYGGSQQFSASRLTFNGCNTAVQLIWDWGWVWKSTIIKNGKVGFRLYNDANSEIPGSVTIVDSVFTNMSVSAIEMAIPADTKDTGFTGLVLDNVNLGAKIKDYKSTTQILQSGYYKHYVIGATYKDNLRTWTKAQPAYTRASALTGGTVAGLASPPYFERKRNQYADKAVGDFVHLKDLGAKGDGTTDDTVAVQNAFNKYGDGSKIIYANAGTYIIKDTVTIPKDAKIVGETWTQFAASGTKFGSMTKPIPMFKVGNVGDIGTVELQDLILTSKGSTPGLTVMQWNVEAKTKGAAALWDVHVRLGGATGTSLTPADCPPSTSGTNPAKCQVASMLLHVTSKASGYFENMWLWVADHMIDDPLLNDATNNMDQLSVYSARGALIESQKPTFFYGTASEHSVMYQYNFFGAQNIYTTMIQTESPYYQPTPKPPAPFTSAVNVFVGDPSYACTGGDADGCDESWAVMMKDCQNVHIGGAGTYSWFSTYAQTCVDPHTCQKALWLVDRNYNNNRIHNLISIGAKNTIVTPDGKTLISANTNQAISGHPAWSHITLYEVPSSGTAPVIETCLDSDRMYSTQDMGKAEIDIWSNDGTKLDYAEDTDPHQFVTIVNLTPYKFVLTAGPTPYQFKTWNFGDIPSGKARKNEATYDNSLGKDFTTTNGYANYKLEGTDKTFVVHVTTHMNDNYERRVVFDLGGMGMGWRELGFPGERVSVALVITGSEKFGYVNSLQLNNAAWMKSMYSVIKDRDLRHVVVPGAHDAGESRISSPGSGWTGGGIPANTETQSLDHYNQLIVGTRYFDMRLVSVKGGDYWAAHVSTETAATPFGATGESLDALIAGVNRFTTDYPGEVIVWYIRYMVDLDNGKASSSARYWSTEKANNFYTKLESINNRCIGLASTPTFDRQAVKTFMDANSGKGCVLLLTDGSLNAGVPKDKSASGIYHAPTYFHRDDYWAEERYTKQNADKQLIRLASHVRDDSSVESGGSDDYYIMQWQCTPGFEDMSDPPTLQLIANQETNPAFYHYALNAISPERFPTVILHDAVGLFHVKDLSASNYNPMMQTLVIGLNLYMVTQNCKVSSVKNPLLKDKAQARIASTSSSGGADGFNVFSGVIFANGTVLDSRPENFCDTCTYNNTAAVNHPPK